MKADEYVIGHWEKNRIWENNQRPHHQKRLSMCAGYAVGKSFVDVGCCFGHSTQALKALHPGDWSGVDFSEYAVNKAKVLFPDIVFQYAPNFRGLMACGKFDTVVCSEVVEHVENDKELVRYLKRMTKKTLIITTPNKSVNDPGHLRLYDRATIIGLFTAKDIVSIEEITPFYYIVLTKGK